MIYVTHDQTEALTFADQVVVMQTGQILQEGTPEQLFERPAHTFVGHFIGSPGMNIAPCTIDGDDALVAGHRVPLPTGLAKRARILVADPSPDAPDDTTDSVPALELGIRPRHIEPCPDDAPGSLPVQVSAVADHGRFLAITGALGDVSLQLVARPGTDIHPGAVYRARFPRERICLYHQRRIIEPQADCDR